MAPRRGVETTFLILVAISTRIAHWSKPPSRIRTKRHEKAAAATTHLSLFGWRAHRQAMKAPLDQKTSLDQTGDFLSSTLIELVDVKPSAPEMEFFAMSAPSFSSQISMTPCAPQLTPSAFNYAPSAPELTPTCLWRNVAWGQEIPV